MKGEDLYEKERILGYEVFSSIYLLQDALVDMDLYLVLMEGAQQSSALFLFIFTQIYR